MRNFLLLVSLCLLSVIADAKTYYVSTTGNDNNTGTITAPYKTWAKLSTVMIAGDIAYIRGGTYTSSFGASAASASVHCYWQNMHGTSTNWIIIQNYPGENPVLDLTSVGVPTYPDPTGIYVKNCSYVRFKGLRVTGLQQIHDGTGISRGWSIDNCPNTIIEQCEVDHIGGGGYQIYNGSNDVLYLNCDAHHNDDRWSGGSAGAWGGADGFSCTGHDNSTRTTFDGCRSYWNSDDGWDNFNTDGIRTWKNCWSFNNGYQPGTFLAGGDGNGFKLGPADNAISTTDRLTTLRFLNNCVAFNNRLNGFDQNGTPSMLYQLYNCTAYKNGSAALGGNGFQFQYWSTGTTNTLPQAFKNNVSYLNNQQDLRFTGPGTNNTNNTWNGGVTVNTSDFASLDSTGVTGPRQSDGSLPNISFLKLANGSDLINSGINIGLPFLSTAPDLGAFEFGAIIVPVTLVDFSATERSGRTLLQWSTATEINSNHFDVERSTDGQNFDKIATVASNGNTNVLINYQTTDNFPSLGVNYYRLKMVDNDGSYQYSKTVSVNFKSNANTGSFEIKTAVVSHKTLQLNVSSSLQQPASLSMYDAIGRMLFTSDITLQKGMNNVNKPLTPSTGVYFLKLKTSDAMTTLSLLNGE